MKDRVAELLEFLDRAPTPQHAVAEAARRLAAAGYNAFDEAEPWQLAPGARGFVVRGGSLLAFEFGGAEPAAAGFRIVGAHTDSPNLRLRPQPERTRAGLRQLGLEPYGGLLLHTWFDRDLSLAGEVVLHGGAGRRALLVDFARPLLRIPNLAIHLTRAKEKDAFAPDAQRECVPVHALVSAPEFFELLVEEAARAAGSPVAREDLLAFDLMAYDVQCAARAGAQGEFIQAARLDNLVSCHAGLSALLGAAPAPRATRVLVLYDHEEVGSRSQTGAAGPLLRDLLERLVLASGGGREELQRALARSLLLSADMAHALHPNYEDRHDAEHAPRLGAGPVIKTNASQSYATDARAQAEVVGFCRDLGIAPQRFVSRNDLRCGSTIGPLSAASAGIAAVDLGSPMLSMHSCREMAAAADVAPLVALLQRHFEAGA